MIAVKVLMAGHSSKFNVRINIPYLYSLSKSSRKMSPNGEETYAQKQENNTDSPLLFETLLRNSAFDKLLR